MAGGRNILNSALDTIDPGAEPISTTTARIIADPNLFLGEFGDVLGSSIGRYLFSDRPLAAIPASAFLGTLGRNIADFISSGGISADLGKAGAVFNRTFSDFGQELGQAFQSAAIGSVSSFLTLELGNAVGISGFGGELFQTGTASVLGTVLNNAVDIANGSKTVSQLFAGLNGDGLFGNAVDPLNLKDWNPGLLSSAVGSFLGAKLGSLILSPTNTEGAILSSVGSTVGAWAFGAGAASAGSIGSIGASIATAFGSLGNVVAPLVGSLIGFLLGSLIGRLFGKKKPRVPSASGEIYLDRVSGYWAQGGVTVQNNGNRSLVMSMAQTAVDSINGTISYIVGGADVAPNANATTPRERLGHSGQTIWFDKLVGSSWVRQYSGEDADVAVEKASMSAILDTRIKGGDLLAKRAIYSQPAASLESMLGNIQVSVDYGEYLRNRQLINGLIQAAPDSAFTAAWLVTLSRASELGLGNYQASDFFGGLAGFADSFGFGRGQLSDRLGIGYEHIGLSFEGSALRIASDDGSGAFALLSASNNVGDANLAAQSALIADFGTNVGYTPWTGQATAGNDVWIAAGGGPVTMDDTGTQYYGYWDPYYGYYQYPVTVSGGDDIFVGSSYDDTLFGRAGWDWLDGGEGADLIDGGENDDVLLGRGGNDRILGGDGNDYLAGGDGDDYFYDAARTWGLYGGEGNDILVGGGGTDSPYGENGDDIFMVDQDGGGVWDALTGGGGQDTLSYERFTSGVYVDFATLGGWSWDPSAKYIYGDAISGMENVTGSRFADTIYGDSGANLIKGLEGDDQLIGRDGDDVLEGGRGVNTLDGGNGFDTASYQSATSGVTASLLLGSGALDGGADAFSGVEGLRGSNFGDDLTGSAGDDVLSGLAGDDLFGFTSGNDQIDGGIGFDTLDAGAATGAISVYYDEGYYDPYYGYYPGAGWIASVAGQGTTTFAGLEGFIGSAFDDSLSGSSTDEAFDGGGGNDFLAGGSGSDTYVYREGDGHDTIYDSSDGSNAIIIDQPTFRWGDLYIQGADYRYQSGNLGIGFRGSSDVITVGGNFSYVNSGNNAGNHNHVIKTLSLAGSDVDISQIDWTPSDPYSDYSTTVYGAQNRADLIFAYGGDDTIYTAGDVSAYETRGNVVYAGDGNDAIFGSYGDDQYIFERGNGVDTLSDTGGDDAIVMGPSVAADEVIYEVVTTSGSSGDYGSAADFYVGIRDLSNPNASASQVADRIRIVGGGTKLVGAVYGTESYNTVEHIRVDGQEIDLTKADINWTVSYYYDGGWYFPIALDLDGDGIELRSVEGSRIASVESDGTITRMGWLGQDDGFLALDRDGNGVIDRIGEISFVGDLAGAKTDLEGLAAYDSNADGKLDASDKRWGEFKIWQDKNQDGFGSKNELVNLDEAGVSAISLKGQLTGFTKADGPDNTVIATTDIVWKDAARTGSAYDVALARLQVRTDDAAKGLTDLDAKARGKKSDDIEAKLRGIQTLTPEQAAAIKDKKFKQVDDGSGGQFYRVETLLGNGSAKVKDGLYSVDPKVAKLAADTGRKLSVLDQFADSEWTKAGSIKLGEADIRGADAPFKKAELTDAQKVVIDDARKIVADRKVADDAKGAERAAKDAADAVLRPAPTPPSAQELERLKRNDKFKLLEGAADTAKGTKASQTQQMTTAAPADSTARRSDSEDTAFTSAEESETTRQRAIEPAETGQRSSKAEPTPQGSAPDEQSAEADVYGVVIRAANARLVQALASFGDAPAMMANYQGLNVANDAQAAWLSVDAMPSVQRLASIR